MKKPISFFKPLVKIGTSLHIRVPKNAIKYLEVEEGDVVNITIKTPEEEVVPKKFLLPYKKYIPEFKDYSLNDLNVCMFFFNIENALEDKDKIKDFEKMIVKQKGKTFLKKYRVFVEAIKNPEAMKKIVEDSSKVSEDFKESMNISMGKN